MFVAAIFVIGVLLVARGRVLAPLERQAVLGEAVLRTPVNLESARVVTWEVPKDQWQYEDGQAKLSLLVRRGEGTTCAVRGKSPLKVVVAATGTLESGEQYDRLVRNWYYTTSEPFNPKARLWEAFGPEDAEYGLGAVAIYPFEKLRISLNVEAPDPGLGPCAPRLQLVPSVDYAITEHLTLLRFVRDTALGLCILSVAGLAWHALAGKKRAA